MSKDQILGIIRHVLTALGGALVASGDLEPEQLETVIGAVVTLLGVAWSWWVKRQA